MGESPARVQPPPLQAELQSGVLPPPGRGGGEAGEAEEEAGEAGGGRGHHRAAETGPAGQGGQGEWTRSVNTKVWTDM